LERKKGAYNTELKKDTYITELSKLRQRKEAWKSFLFEYILDLEALKLPPITEAAPHH